MLRGEDDIMYYSDSARRQQQILKRYKVLTVVFCTTTIAFGAAAGFLSYQCDYLSNFF